MRYRETYIAVPSSTAVRDAILAASTSMDSGDGSAYVLDRAVHRGLSRMAARFVRPHVTPMSAAMPGLAAEGADKALAFAADDDTVEPAFGGLAPPVYLDKIAQDLATVVYGAVRDNAGDALLRAARKTSRVNNEFKTLM
jgi:hypothetical protein